MSNKKKKRKITAVGERAKARALRSHELFIKGLSKRQIAQVLRISYHTVEKYILDRQSEIAKELSEQVAAFKSRNFWSERLEDLRMRRKEMWIALAEGKSDRTMVIKALTDIDKEIERVLLSSGIRLSDVNPEDLATETIRIIHEDKKSE